MALFAALSYAITQSSRGGGTIEKEQAVLDASTSRFCNAYVDQAVMRLETIGGCTEGEISYEYNGNNVNADAPADKHCHVFDAAGAGATPCGSYLLGTTLVSEGKPITGSLTYVGGSGASTGDNASLNDGDINTYTADPAASGPWTYVRIDLESAMEVIRVGIIVAPEWGVTYDTTMVLSYSDDDSTYTPVGPFTIIAGTDQTPQYFDFSSSGAHRYWRMDYSSGEQANFWIAEVQLFAAS